MQTFTLFYAWFKSQLKKKHITLMLRWWKTACALYKYFKCTMSLLIITRWVTGKHYIFANFQLIVCIFLFFKNEKDDDRNKSRRPSNAVANTKENDALVKLRRRSSGINALVNRLCFLISISSDNELDSKIHLGPIVRIVLENLLIYSSHNYPEPRFNQYLSIIIIPTSHTNLLRNIMWKYYTKQNPSDIGWLKSCATKKFESSILKNIHCHNMGYLDCKASVFPLPLDHRTILKSQWIITFKFRNRLHVLPSPANRKWKKRTFYN